MCEVSECVAKPPAPAGESDFGQAPFLEGLKGLFDWLGGVGRVLSGALGWLFAPVIWAVGLLAFLSTGMAYALEAAFQAGEPLARLLPCSEPVLIASVLLLLLVRAVMLPFALRASKSSTTMAVLNSTVIKQATARHRGNRGAMERELTEIYRKNRVNPLTGCVPVLLAIPLFVAFWGLLKGLTIRSATGTFQPNFVHSGTDLGAHLTAADTLTSWGMNLLIPVTTVGLCAALVPYLLVFGICALLTYAQYRMTFAGRTGPVRRTGGRLVLLTIAGLVLLPTFFVILKVVDTILMLGQTRMAKNVEEKTLTRLRHNPEFQAMVGEQLGSSAFDVHQERIRRNGPGDDLTGH